jgi:hypothetical protein
MSNRSNPTNTLPTTGGKTQSGRKSLALSERETGLINDAFCAVHYSSKNVALEVSRLRAMRDVLNFAAVIYGAPENAGDEPWRVPGEIKAIRNVSDKVSKWLEAM